jgi:hypothetical protein
MFRQTKLVHQKQSRKKCEYYQTLTAAERIASLCVASGFQGHEDHGPVHRVLLHEAQRLV